MVGGTHTTLSYHKRLLTTLQLRTCVCPGCRRSGFVWSR